MNIRRMIYGTIFFLFFIGAMATAHARVINDAEFGFQITIPNNWQTNSFMDGSDKVWAFAAPDNNAAVRVRTFRTQPGLSMTMLISAFENQILAGGQRLLLEPYTLNGIVGQMAGYKGRFNNVDVGVGCFYTIQKQNAYIVWSMIPVSLFKSRSGETDAIINSFTLAGIGAARQTPPPTMDQGKADGQCRRAGEIYTDGTGNRQTKKRGGTYLTITKAELPLNSSININVLSGHLSYVTVHARYDTGIWKTAYQGPLTSFSVNRHFKSFLDNPNCTHLVISVNGAHEQYEPIACRAEVNICRKDGARDSAKPPLVSKSGSFQYQILTVDDGNFEFLYPKHFTRFQQSEGQSQWTDPHAPAGTGVIMIIQTMSRSMGNSLASVHDKLVNQVKSNSGAKLLGSKRLQVNGLQAYELQFTLDQRNHRKHFYYLVLDVQGPNVATVSYVGPESMLQEIKGHFEKLKESVRQSKNSGTGDNSAIPQQASKTIRPDNSERATKAPPAKSVRHIDLSEFPLFVPYTWDHIPEKLIARPEASAFVLPAYDTVEERNVSGGRIQKDYKKNGKMVAAQLFDGNTYKAVSIWKPDGRGRVYVEFWRDGSVSGVEYIEGMYKQGICRYWDEGGVIKNIATYRDNKLDGANVSWYPKPEHFLRRVEHFNHGQRQGFLRTYFQRNGQLEEESQWKDGVWFKRTYYTESGAVRSVLK